MNLFRKLLGLATSDRPARDGPPVTPPPADARSWLRVASERAFVWRDMGELALPSQHIFVGDPTWGDDYHMKQTAPVDADRVTVWVFESGEESDAFHAHTNALVWLEISGTPPTTRGLALDFGVDAACFAFGDLETGRAFTRLTELESAAGRGDSFEWIGPYINEHPNFARWLSIPPDGQPMFVASTGSDGGFSAVWLHDAQDSLSGILIDIAGRASDLRYLDKLLPPRGG